MLKMCIKSAPLLKAKIRFLTAHIFLRIRVVSTICCQLKQQNSSTVQKTARCLLCKLFQCWYKFLQWILVWNVHGNFGVDILYLLNGDAYTSFNCKNKYLLHWIRIVQSISKSSISIEQPTSVDFSNYGITWHHFEWNIWNSHLTGYVFGTIETEL